MKLTAKIRIFPSEKQKELLWILSEKCRLIYNFALEKYKENYNNYKTIAYLKKEIIKPLWIFRPDPYEDVFKIDKNTTDKWFRDLRNNKYPEYQWVLERVLSVLLRNLDDDFWKITKQISAWRKNPQFNQNTGKPINKPSLPRFKGKKHFTTMSYNRDGFTFFEYKQIKLSHQHPDYDKNLLTFKISKNARFRIKKCLEGKIKQVEIKKEDEKWFILIITETKIPKYQDNGKYQAMDLGITDIVTAVNSKGKFIHKKNKIQPLEQYWQPKITELQSKRDHCKHPSQKHPNFKKSKRYIFYDNKLKKMIRKKTNQYKDFQHNLSKKIIENTKANTIIVGDLNVKGMGKHKKGTGVGIITKANKTLNRRILSGSLGRFVQFLTYKAEMQGKRIIKIDESNTSKTCCLCGSKKKMELNDREYICDKCGNIMNRDENSAINIMQRFLETRQDYDFLSQNAFLQGNSFLKLFSVNSIQQLDFG